MTDRYPIDPRDEIRECSECNGRSPLSSCVPCTSRGYVVGRWVPTRELHRMTTTKTEEARRLAAAIDDEMNVRRMLAHAHEAARQLCTLATGVDRLEAENAALRATLGRIGGIVPLILGALPWGAFKGALLEDGALKEAVAIDAAMKEKP